MSVENISLIIGAVGLFLVLLYATATGHGSRKPVPTPMVSNNCSTELPTPIRIKKQTINFKPPYILSRLPPPGSCPSGYYNFTDEFGNTLCCASDNIDPYTYTCPASGELGICSMSPGIEDTRRESDDIRHYPLCQAISLQQQQSKSGKLCPRKFQYHIDPPGSTYRCCNLAAASTAIQCPSTSFCEGLSPGRNVFNTPSSCQTERLIENLTCPPGTHLLPQMKGTSVRTSDLLIPVCVGVKGNCIPAPVLKELNGIGLFNDINIDKNITNCDVYDKIVNERSIYQDYDTNISRDL